MQHVLVFFVRMENFDFRLHHERVSIRPVKLDFAEESDAAIWNHAVQVSFSVKPPGVKLRPASVFKYRFENPRPPPETGKLGCTHLRQYGRLLARRELRDALYVCAVFIAKRCVVQEIGYR